MIKKVVSLIVLAVGLFNLGVGIWAFAAPRAFFDTVATFPPFNEHLFHDLGAFQGALGATLLIGLRVRSGLIVAMLGNLLGAIAHFISHIIDSDLGGRSTDPIAMGFLAAALAFALVVYQQQPKSHPTRETSS